MTLTDAAKIDAAIAVYVQIYTGAKMVQPADQADTDSQLSSTVFHLGVKLDRAPQGALIDIGCGAGTLLRRLSPGPVQQGR